MILVKAHFHLLKGFQSFYNMIVVPTPTRDGAIYFDWCLIFINRPTRKNRMLSFKQQIGSVPWALSSFPSILQLGLIEPMYSFSLVCHAPQFGRLEFCNVNSYISICQIENNLDDHEIKAHNSELN